MQKVHNISLLSYLFLLTCHPCHFGSSNASHVTRPTVSSLAGYLKTQPKLLGRSINIAFNKTLFLYNAFFVCCSLHCTCVSPRACVCVPPFCCVNLFRERGVRREGFSNFVELLLQPFCKFYVYYICEFALFIYAREHNAHTHTGLVSECVCVCACIMQPPLLNFTLIACTNCFTMRKLLPASVAHSHNPRTNWHID